MRKWFFIEHPTRGVFVESDWSGVEYKPKFKWSILVTEGYAFYNMNAVNKEMNKWSNKIRNRCTIKEISRD